MAKSVRPKQLSERSGFCLQAWCDYEVACFRELSSSSSGQDRAPEEASPGAKQMFDKSKLVWRHILASLNGFRSGLKLGVNVGEGEIAGLPHLKNEGVVLPLSYSYVTAFRLSRSGKSYRLLAL